MSVDNSAIVAPFVPETDDGDTFLYTELLDRGKAKGNNGVRLLRTFYHRSRAEFWDRWPAIKALCDVAGVRAYTRLAPRSFKKVAAEHLRLCTEAFIAGNHVGVKSLYNRACGIVTPNRKLWMLDVDTVTDQTEGLGARLRDDGHLVATIPSKKGKHYIIEPLDGRVYFGERGWYVYGEISLHKDHGTNLYIPDTAD